MKTISLREWIKDNRKEIDACILRICPNIQLNDNERRLWILNDEGIYNWVRSEGVNV